MISSQAVNPDVSKRILACKDTYKYVDALAIAPYFNGDLKVNGVNSNVEDLFGGGLFDKGITYITDIVAKQKLEAKKYSLKFITYEAGQHMVSNGDVVQTAVCLAANRDLRMKAVYKKYLQALKVAGIEMITHFSSIGTFTTYGSWGLLEAQNMNPSKAPKFQAVQEFISETAVCTPPAETNNCPNKCSNQGWCLDNNKCGCYDGFWGEDCSQPSYIDVKDCGYYCNILNGVNPGVCTYDHSEDNKRYFKCQCNAGWTGYYCEFAVCENDCNYNGNCVAPGTCRYNLICFNQHKIQKHLYI